MDNEARPKKTIKIPIEDVPAALRYPQTYLRNKHNLRIGAIQQFFEPRMFERCFYRQHHPRYINPVDEFRIQLDENLRWQDDKRPRFLHIDLGLRHDSAGMTCSYIEDFTNIEIKPGDEEQDEEAVKAKEATAIVGVDFLLEAHPERFAGKEVAIQTLRQLIWECQKRGMVIGLITLDGWQSADSIQIFTAYRVKADTLSIDNTMTKVTVDSDGKIKRMATKNPGAAMENLWLLARERRLGLPYHKTIVEEAKWQQQDEVTKKVSKMPGSSDNLIQSLAGSTFNAINNVSLSWLAVLQFKGRNKHGGISTRERQQMRAAKERYDYYYKGSFLSEQYGRQGGDDEGVRGADEHSTGLEIFGL